MERRVCYACNDRIGFFRAALRPVEALFDSAFDGNVRAAFCSRRCKDDAIANAAAVRKTFPPPPDLGTEPDRSADDDATPSDPPRTTRTS